MATYGGKREGAGRPKGVKNLETINRDEARKQMQAYILKQLEPLLRAQASLARGVQYVYKVEPILNAEGKVIKQESRQVKDPEEMKHALDVLNGIEDSSEGEYYYLTSEKPDLRAVDSMLDRVFGRATQSMEIDNPKDNEELKKINDTLKEMYHNVKSGKSKAKN